MLLTQEGLRALHHFRISAAPQYDEQWNRIEGNDGLMLSCAYAEEYGFSGCEVKWQKQWPGHVAAPTIRDLAKVAERHYNEAHRVDDPKTSEATAPEEAVNQ